MGVCNSRSSSRSSKSDNLDPSSVVKGRKQLRKRTPVSASESMTMKPSSDKEVASKSSNSNSDVLASGRTNSVRQTGALQQSKPEKETNSKATIKRNKIQDNSQPEDSLMTTTSSRNEVQKTSASLQVGQQKSKNQPSASQQKLSSSSSEVTQLSKPSPPANSLSPSNGSKIQDNMQPKDSLQASGIKKFQNISRPLIPGAVKTNNQHFTSELKPPGKSSGKPGEGYLRSAESPVTHYITWDGFDDTHEPVRELCPVCKCSVLYDQDHGGDLSYVLGYDNQLMPSTLPEVSILSCGHAYHVQCLDKVTTPEQKCDPPCFVCPSF